MDFQTFDRETERKRKSIGGALCPAGASHHNAPVFEVEGRKRTRLRRRQRKLFCGEELPAAKRLRGCEKVEIDPIGRGFYVARQIEPPVRSDKRSTRKHGS